MWDPEDQDNEYDLGNIENTTCTIIYWVMQTITWLALVGAIIALIVFDKLIYFAIFGGIYVLYLVIEFCSVTPKYLRNKNKSNEGLNELMGKIFKTPPKISLFGKCYHFVYSGTSKHRTRRRVVSHSETYEIPYYSSRDVSGLFLLNCSKENIKGKYYIKLELNEEINFADEISYSDYIIQKTNFWKVNEKRDEYFYFKESRIIQDKEQFYLIKLGENDSCIANFFFFFIFTVFMLSEIYKLIFNSKCIYFKYTVRKLVSSRYDLNQPKYEKFIPQLDLIVNQYTYGEDHYNYLNKNYILVLPTDEELRIAQQYKKKFQIIKFLVKDQI